MSEDTRSEDTRSEVLNAIPYGFYIVGVIDNDGEANGFTANWVSQVSFKPPRVIVAVHNAHHSHDLIESGGVFSLNFLDKTQEELARRLAQHQEPEGDSVAGARFTRGPETEAPLFDDSFAYLECRVVDKLETGDHTVFFGEVVGEDLKRQANVLTTLETPLHYEE